LLNYFDSPTLLYYRGTADLNVSKIISVIGSRSHTDYGKQITEEFIKELSEQDVLVISGPAYSIDSIADKSAVKNQLKLLVCWHMA